jgi:hypothetical protein
MNPYLSTLINQSRLTPGERLLTLSPFHYPYSQRSQTLMEQSPECSIKMTVSHLRPPSPHDIFRYRYQHGTNLGGIFNLEYWLYPSLHDEDTFFPSELNAILSYVELKHPTPGQEC